MSDLAGTEEIRSRINFARSAFPRLQSCLWSRCDILLRTIGRAYQAVVRSILLYGCETWRVRVADERMLEVFDMTVIIPYELLHLNFIKRAANISQLAWMSWVFYGPPGGNISWYCEIIRVKRAQCVAIQTGYPINVPIFDIFIALRSCPHICQALNVVINRLTQR